MLFSFFFFVFTKTTSRNPGVPPAGSELLLPAGLWINFLMLPFQNTHRVPGGDRAERVRAATERQGGQ